LILYRKNAAFKDADPFEMRREKGRTNNGGQKE
jgi:hypothetical protein